MKERKLYFVNFVLNDRSSRLLGWSWNKFSYCSILNDLLSSLFVKEKKWYLVNFILNDRSSILIDLEINLISKKKRNGRFFYFYIRLQSFLEFPVLDLSREKAKEKSERLSFTFHVPWKCPRRALECEIRRTTHRTHLQCFEQSPISRYRSWKTLVWRKHDVPRCQRGRSFAYV